MNKVFSQLVSQFREYFKALPPIKRSSVIVSSIVLVIALTIIMLMLTGKSYSPVFTNVSPDQLPLVVDKLQKKNVPFKLEDDGKTVLVPTELLHVTQMSLMSELGGTKIGSTGLELFEKQDFGVTSYAQRVNYQRALQGELIRAINTLTSVKQSKVLLAIPPKKTFLEEVGEPTASVVLELYPGKTLTSDQVRGITFLVSSSVENLEAEKVTVVDSRGKVLSKHYTSDAGASAELLDIKKKYESELQQKIESILSKVVGNGKVIAEVDATIDTRNKTTVQETVDPDKTAIRSSVSESEFLDGSRTNPTGIPGARANLPGADDQGQVGFKQNVNKELKTTNFAVPKTVENIQESAGSLKRVSVAVLVDGITSKVKGENGEVTEQWTPRTQEELAKYENIVRNAIGFNDKRGDSVRIENIQFEKEDFAESEKILSSLERKKLLHALFKWSLLGFSLALFFFIVVRPFMRWVTDSFQETVEDMLPKTIEELEELQSVDSTLPGMSTALPMLEESIDPDKAESELLKERIISLIDDDEEKASGAFSLWLNRRDL